MKKIIALALAAVMLLSFAACGSGTASVKNPVDILNAVWEKYAEDQKFFAMGGDADNIVDNAPGAYSLDDADSLSAQLVCLPDAAKMVDSAASIIHAMNANTFTGAAYHLASGAKAADFVTAMEDGITNNQWICGFPEKLLIATVSDENVVVAFGASDLIETFKTHLTEAFSGAKIEVEKAL